MANKAEQTITVNFKATGEKPLIDAINALNRAVSYTHLTLPTNREV